MRAVERVHQLMSLTASTLRWPPESQALHAEPEGLVPVVQGLVALKES